MPDVETPIVTHADTGDSSLCPCCESDLNVDGNENYCPGCDRWICPVCRRSCGDESEAPVCKHYVADWSNFSQEYCDVQGRDEEVFETFRWHETLSDDILQKIEQLSPEQRKERLGCFAVPEDAYRPLEEVAQCLDIPLVRAYNNELNFFIMHFSSLGGDEIWRRLSEARQTFEEGIAALE